MDATEVMLESGVSGKTYRAPGLAGQRGVRSRPPGRIQPASPCKNHPREYASNVQDLYGHHISYLRVSITDRCNERCLYCMPQELQEWLPRNDILTYEEITRLVRDRRHASASLNYGSRAANR